MNRFCIAAIFTVLTPIMPLAADEPKAPGTVRQTSTCDGKAMTDDRRIEPWSYLGMDQVAAKRQ
jgi:hypothetical protein